MDLFVASSGPLEFLDFISVRGLSVHDALREGDQFGAEIVPVAFGEGGRARVGERGLGPCSSLGLGLAQRRERPKVERLGRAAHTVENVGPHVHGAVPQKVEHGPKVGRIAIDKVGVPAAHTLCC